MTRVTIFRVDPVCMSVYLLRDRIGLATATLFVQRAREKRGEQGAASYRTPLYPLTPLVFLIVTAVIIWSDFTNSGPIPGTPIPRAMAGVLIAATGLPVYWLGWRGRGRTPRPGNAA